jgi:hypothetical protein
VIVEGGRPYLGERRQVRITATARTGASAVLAQTGDGRGDEAPSSGGRRRSRRGSR